MIVSDPTPTPPAPVVSKETRRPFWFWILLAAGIVAVLYFVGRYVLGAFLALSFFGIIFGLATKDQSDYYKLLPQVQATPDITVSSFSCGTSPYAWAVIEKDAVAMGNSFELGTKSHIYTYRVVSLLKNHQIVAEAQTHVLNDQFPIGGPFIKTAVLSRSIFNSRDAQYWLHSFYSSALIPNSKISVQDFDMVSDCLFENASKLDTDENKNDTYPAPIGWISLKDDTVQQDASGDAQFSCDNGSTAVVTGGRRVWFYTKDSSGKAVYSWKPEYWLTLDGKIHDTEVYSGIAPGGQDPVKVFPHCADTKGQTLTDFLDGIPSRIHFYQ